jgi:large subunit ribosomal protein L28
MSKCKICGRGPQFGHNVSHSMRHTKRRWNINIQRTRLTVDGKQQSVAVCTKCLKTLSKAQ